jgi:hypothetical protein
MTKLKVWKDFLKDKLEKIKKVEYEIQNDFITTDFQVINDTSLGGYVVRDGPYQYGTDAQGKPIVKYKKWDNLKEAYGSLNKVIGYGSRYNDSHYEADDRMIGYWDTFKLIPKGTKGPTEPYVDEKYNRVWSKLNTHKDILELSDLDLEDLKKLPVSSSYQDLGEGDQQIVGKVFHIATSLNKTEQDRCSSMDGTPCNVSPIGDTIHDQNIKGDNKPTHDFDNNNGVLSADLSQPPTNKKKNDAKDMPKEKKKEPEVEQDTIKEPTEDIEPTEDAMKTTDKGAAPSYEKEDKKPLLEENADETAPNQPTKKKDTIEVPIETMEDLLKRMDDLESKAKENEPMLTKIAEDNKAKDAKDFEDLQESLQKEPYNVPKDTIEGKDLAWLKDKKDFLDSLPMIQDFIREQPLTHEDVNKHLFDFESPQNDPLAEVFSRAQQDFKRANDFGDGD